MGGLSMFYFPFGDQYRYFNDLELNKFLSFDQVFDFNSVMIFKTFNIINLMVFFAAKLNFNLETIRFILTFIGCCLIFKIFIDLDSHGFLSESKKRRFIAFIILFLSIPYYLINYGFRTGFGSCLLTYGVYVCYIKKNILKGLLFLVLATFSHFLFLVHTVAFIVLYFIDVHLTRNKALAFSIVLFFFSMSIFNFLYGHIEFVDNIMNSYVYGANHGMGTYYWFSPSAKEMWLNGILNTVLLYVVFFRFKKQGRFENVLYFLFILMIFAAPYATFFQRIIRSLIPIISLYLVVHIRYKKVYNARYLILCGVFITFIVPFWVHRHKYSYGRIDKVLYSSLPVMLSNHYDTKTVYKKVFDNGEFDK